MRTILPLLALLLLLAACGDGEPTVPVLPDIGKAPAPPVPEPERITVDHILIGVNSPRFRQGKLDFAEARQLAYETLVKLQNGADFDELKQRLSEDRGDPNKPAGGPYALGNHGVQVAGPPKEFSRGNMVPAFGDVGFKLPLGAVWIAEHDAQTSPYGFHIIKRVK